MNERRPVLAAVRQYDEAHRTRRISENLQSKAEEQCDQNSIKQSQEEFEQSDAAMWRAVYTALNAYSAPSNWHGTNPCEAFPQEMAWAISEQLRSLIEKGELPARWSALRKRTGKNKPEADDARCDAVAYIEACRHGMIYHPTKSPIKDVAKAYGVHRRTVETWCANEALKPSDRKHWMGQQGMALEVMEQSGRRFLSLQPKMRKSGQSPE